MHIIANLNFESAYHGRFYDGITYNVSDEVGRAWCRSRLVRKEPPHITQAVKARAAAQANRRNRER